MAADFVALLAAWATHTPTNPENPRRDSTGHAARTMWSANPALEPEGSAGVPPVKDVKLRWPFSDAAASFKELALSLAHFAGLRPPITSMQVPAPAPRNMSLAARRVVSVFVGTSRMLKTLVIRCRARDAFFI
eukprot:scaffold19495_cov102-Isochrysis_galbana.AAC.3